MNAKHEFLQIEQFLGGYFHQDWMDEFDSKAGASAAASAGAGLTFDTVIVSP